MPTIEFDDQFVLEPAAPVRERYDTAAILRRNIADAEKEMQRQAERAESYAEAMRSLASYVGAGGYNADTVDAGVFEEKIRWGIGVIQDRLAGAIERELVARTSLIEARNDIQTWIDSRNEWMKRAEAAESELEAVREDNHAMMLEIDGLRKELAKLREQKPALYMAFSECGQFIRYWTRDTANLDATMAVNDFTVLEFFARPTPAPAVPEEWRRVIDAALGLLESTTCETGVCMCGDSVIGHADFSVGHSACDSGTYHQLGVIEQLRALLQSAEVRHD